MFSELFLSPNIFTAVLALVILYLIKLALSRGSSNVPPGPTGYPVIGSLRMVAKKHVYKVYRDLRQKYGDIFSIRLGPKLFVVINGYDNIREAFLKKGDVFSDRPDLYPITVLLKENGIIASSGTHWKETRTFALTTLRDFGFGRKSMEARIAEEVEAFLQIVDDANGKPFDIQTPLQISVSNVICSIAFGKRFDYSDEKFKKLLLLLDKALRINVFAGPLALFPFLRFLPGDLFHFKEFSSMLQDIFTFLDEIIENHRESFDANSPGDFIDSYFVEQLKKDSDIMTDFNLKISIFNLFAAGTQTTQSTIRWAILFMLLNRNVQDRLREDVDRVIGTSRKPSLSDRQHMPYFDAFLTETQRFGNIVPLSIPHGAKSDIHFKGFTLPKGSVILPNLDSVLHDSDTFPNPEKFDPTRFLDSDGKLYGTEKVIPFSIGRRSCLGESLARMELFLFLTSLIQRFTFLPDDASDFPSLDPADGFARSPDRFKFRAIRNT